MCDFFGTAIREDICWDISHLFPINNIKVFNLEDFEQPITSNDMAALLGALRYNTWFTGFVARSLSIDLKKSFPDIAKLLSVNTSIKELVLSDIGMVKESGVWIAEALKGNGETAVQIIDFSKNDLDDRAIAALAITIGGMPHGIVDLNLSNCSINRAPLSTLCSSFKKNPQMTTSLMKLNLSNNQLDSEGSSSLTSWLTNPNKLEDLDLSYTNANLESILPALTRGSTGMKVLNLSGNRLTPRAVQYLVSFIQSSSSLSSLNLSNTFLTPDQLPSIIQSINANRGLTDLELNISNNKIGSVGASSLSSLSQSKTILSLNLADNELGDEGIIVLCGYLENNITMKCLDISRNFSAKATKSRERAVSSFISSIIEGDLPLNQLILQGGKGCYLKLDLLSILDAIGSNDRLEVLDISGNMMGNKGAIALAKNLQINRTLQHLEWDDNSTSYLGFYYIASSLERNKSMKRMILPLSDITSAMRSDDPVKLNKVIMKIQTLLSDNHTSKSYLSPASALSVNQPASFLLSGEREHTERLKLKVKGQNIDLSPEQSLLMKDVENSDQILSSLHSIVENHQRQMAGEISKKLKGITSDLLPVIDTNFNHLVNGMVEVIKSKFKSIEPDAPRRVHASINFGVQRVDREVVERILAGVAASELSSKASAMMTSAMEITTDYLYEKFAEGLQEILDDVRKETQRESIALFDSSSPFQLDDMRSFGSAAPLSPSSSSSSSFIPVTAQSQQRDGRQPTIGKKAPPLSLRPPPSLHPSQPPFHDDDDDDDDDVDDDEVNNNGQYDDDDDEDDNQQYHPPPPPNSRSLRPPPPSQYHPPPSQHHPPPPSHSHPPPPNQSQHHPPPLLRGGGGGRIGDGRGGGGHPNHPNHPPHQGGRGEGRGGGGGGEGRGEGRGGGGGQQNHRGEPPQRGQPHPHAGRGDGRGGGGSGDGRGGHPNQANPQRGGPPPPRDYSPHPRDHAQPPSKLDGGGGGGGPAGGGRGKINIMAGLDPSKMIGGITGGRPPKVEKANSFEPDDLDPLPPPISTKGEDKRKGISLKGKSSSPIPSSSPSPSSPSPSPSPSPAKMMMNNKVNNAVKKPLPPPAKKPSGDKSNIQKMEKPNTPELHHMTRDRPVMQKKRKPPSRRPRNNATRVDDDPSDD